MDLITCCYYSKSLQQCHAMNEKEEKQGYNERILQIDHHTFTLLAFSINGSMRKECPKFYSCLAQLIFEKRDFLQPILSNWIQTTIYLRLLKSSLHCLWGSITICRKTSEFKTDIRVLQTITKIWTRWWSFS